MKTKLLSSTPHKKYAIEVTSADIKELCKFLRNQKEKNLEVVLNGKSIKFNSVAGIKRYAAGFEIGANVAERKIVTGTKESQTIVNKLKYELARAKQDLSVAKDELNKVGKKYMVGRSVMMIRQEAWNDHIAELQDDRMILKEELDRLRPKPMSNAKITNVHSDKLTKRG